MASDLVLEHHLPIFIMIEGHVVDKIDIEREGIQKYGRGKI